MKTIARLFLFLATLPILAAGQFLMRPARHGGTVSTVTQDFNGYTAATSLATFSGWTVTDGTFLTVTGGQVRGNNSGAASIAAYEPAGFTTAANHQTEATLAGASATNGQAHGVAAAIQADGSCYHAYLDAGGSDVLYFGYLDASGAGSDYLNEGTAAPDDKTGIKLRMTVSGTGATRRCTVEYNLGAGWVTPSGYSNRDFGSGKRLDGGDAGIAAFGNLTEVTITSLTITNQ